MLRVCELFSGIGAQSMALTILGIEHESVACDIDAAVSVGTSKTALYNQAGNSIAVPCLVAIFRKLYLEERPRMSAPTLDAWCKKDEIQEAV